MSKASKYNFKPGISGNPNGRPKGALGDKTKEYNKIKRLAAESYGKMFAVLLEKGLAGESWAHQLFYKEFLPKKAREDTVFVDGTDDSVEGQIKALTKALSHFEELTHEDALNRLKILAGVKDTENLSEQTNTIRETRESLTEKIDMIQKIIDNVDQGRESMK